MLEDPNKQVVLPDLRLCRPYSWDEQQQSEQLPRARRTPKKAKVNALFGKKVIMAIKSGGSADPNANRALADVIKLAKANSVPVDVSY